MSNEEIVKTSGTEIVRDGLGSRELRRHETASSAVVAQVRAEIEARCIMARANPRDDDQVRTRLLKACKRTSFADRAFYSLPRGDKPGRLTGTLGRVEGLTVRFAEEAIRVSGNISEETRTLYDDDTKRIIHVQCTDLETNAIHGRDFVIEKTVERRAPKKGQVVLSKRTNSTGEEVFLCQTTEDDLTQKEGSIISKAFRTQSLRLVPPDTLAECEQQIVATIRKDIESDPDTAKKKTADAFAELGIFPAQLREYLGHDLGVCSTVELQELRGLYGALRDNEVTWAEALAAIVAERGPKTKTNGPEVITPAGRVIAHIKATAASKVKEAKAEKAKPASRGAKKGAKDPAEEVHCMVCKKVIVGARVEMSDADGVVGLRHPGCPAPTAAPSDDDDPDKGP